MRARWLLVAACLPGLGCSEALLSRTSFRSHQAYTDASYTSYRQLQSNGGLTKADVLATLGPPIHVIAQEDGDVFVYRRFARDSWIIHLNPSMVSFVGPAPPIPIYHDQRSSGRDDTLMIFFDGEGRARGEGFRLGVEPAQ